MTKKTLLILFGGESNEYEVSLRSATAVIGAIDREKYDVKMLGVTKGGEWKYYSGAPERIADGTWADDEACIHPATVSLDGDGAILAGDQKIKIDVAFPVMHGQYCEDGRLQGLLECAKIPFVGCKTFSAALCMDKVATKLTLAHYGIPMAQHVIVRSDMLANEDAIIAEVSETLGFPCFVKPANSGSSVGCTRVNARPELMDALRAAAAVDGKILVEEYIDAREVEVAVLECEGKMIVSHTGEIEPCTDFYDYDTKYNTDVARQYMPARISPECEEKIRRYAGKVFRALSCRGLSRVDFFVTHEDERVVFNEINTLPGFTSISMYPKLFERDGLSMSRLIDTLAEEALRS